MDKMKIRAVAAILSIIVVILGLYQIFVLGEANWANYLSTILFALVFILEVNEMR